jgi:hypothetical protein
MKMRSFAQLGAAIGTVEERTERAMRESDEYNSARFRMMAQCPGPLRNQCLRIKEFMEAAGIQPPAQMRRALRGEP